MREYFAEVVAQLFCESMEQSGITDHSSQIQAFYRFCNSGRLGNQSDWLNCTFDTFILTETERIELYDLCNNVMARLNNFGEYISVDYLNLMESNKPSLDNRWSWPRAIKTSNMHAVMLLIQELIAGKCQCDNMELNFTGWSPNPFGYNLP